MRTTARVALLLVAVVTCSAASANDCVAAAMGAAASQLYYAGSREYNNTLFIDNARVVVDPAVVVSPRDEHDIALAMNASAACGLRFSVVSGGHSAQGYGLAQNGLTVNMRSLNKTTFSTLADGTQVATIESGSRFAEVYAVMEARGDGSMVIGGGCPQVAVGGFTLGGGWSFISRSYGLAIDQLVSVRMVLPNRTVTTLSASHADQDLWWAVRGGGGGNFGVATHFTTRIVRPNPNSSNGELCWPEFSPLIRTMMTEWIADWHTMPKWSLFDPCWLPIGPNKTRMFCFTVICNNDPAMCDPYLAKVRRFGPTLDTVKPMPFVKWARQNVNVTSAQEGFLYLKSFMFRPGNFTVETIDFLTDALRFAPSPRNLVLFHVAGGAVNEVPHNATAFPHRDTMVMLQVKTIWDYPWQQQENRLWINDVAAGIASNVTGAYVNYIDADLKHWKRDYYGDAGYERLLKIKRRVDPTNFFRFNQSIGA